MTSKPSIHSGSKHYRKMTLKLILLFIVSVSCASTGEMTLANVTRLASGDIFSLIGTDCGPTRCMEASHGTALGGLGDGCICQCRKDTPAFREDRRLCVNHIDECLMASFGRGSTKPVIPFIFLPLKGQIIYPSKEIIFTEVEDAVCAVISAQYLSTSGWVTLRDMVDNDVPFGLYRDEGSTFLQWRGSAVLHARLEGHLVSVHVLCSSRTSHLASSCAAFRVAGASNTGLLDVRSIPFHAGEIVSTDPNQSQGLSVLESLAIGVCVLMLVFIYAAGIIFYVHYKQRQRKKKKDAENNMSSNSSENGSSLESRIDMSNVMLKTNPLLKFNNLGNDYMHDSGMSDSGNDNTLESTKSNSHNNNNKVQKMNSNVLSAMVHSKRKKPSRPSLRQGSNSDRINERLQRRSTSPDTFERAPHSDLSIVDCSDENNYTRCRAISSEGDPIVRKKLYFNPLFFETELLKDPPPAAIEFLIKIREVMSIAKDKMTSKRFIPILSNIPEEDRYHSLDLGWDIPCARRGRRFSAISLKQENSRKSGHCGGCPGCDSTSRPKAVALTRSNSCKSCVSDDYKQRIVRKWLDEVPLPEPTTPAPKPTKSVAKVNGTPRVIEAKPKESRTPVTIDPMQREKTEITEVVPKKKVKDRKNISLPVSEMKTCKLSETIQNKIKNESSEAIKLTISKPIITTVTQPEKTSPANHASRRIRKKLPPPPPPPLKAPAPPPPETPKKEEEPIPKEVKVKMEAVIKELNDCRRVEPVELEEIKLETISPIPIVPKIIIPVLAADSHYYSDDNVLTNSRKKKLSLGEESLDFDSLERNMIRRRRFSLACGPELINMDEFVKDHKPMASKDRLTSSWLDITKVVDVSPTDHKFSQYENHSPAVNEIIVGPPEPLYDNISKPGPLTIQVRGSPVENRRKLYEDFDPDTLDRKPKYDYHAKKRVEKILLKSAGSFKHKSLSPEKDVHKISPVPEFSNKICNLRQIYEMKAKAQQEELQMYKRRGSLQSGGQDLAEFMRSLKTPDLIRNIGGKKEKPPVPPKVRRGSVADLSPKLSEPLRESPPGRRRGEDRDRLGAYSRAENLNARRSGRRSARTRSRRTDLRKLYRTEDSGYMSTDSNESKRRAKYLLQLRPKNTVNENNLIQVTRTVNKPPIVIESDTDDLESLCDGRSESGGESVETDSVFFGNFDDSKEMLAELGLNSFEPRNKLVTGQHEQIDSGFMGETNIILSGDSDSEHRSVISIMTGRDSRVSATSIKNIEDLPYTHTIEC